MNIELCSCTCSTFLREIGFAQIVAQKRSVPHGKGVAEHLVRRQTRRQSLGKRKWRRKRRSRQRMEVMRIGEQKFWSVQMY